MLLNTILPPMREIFSLYSILVNISHKYTVQKIRLLPHRMALILLCGSWDGVSRNKTAFLDYGPIIVFPTSSQKRHVLFIISSNLCLYFPLKLTCWVFNSLGVSLIKCVINQSKRLFQNIIILVFFALFWFQATGPTSYIKLT